MSILFIFITIFAVLYVGAKPSLSYFGIDFLFTADWDPVGKKFGAVVPLYGTLVTSFLAIFLAVPLSLGIAFFITEIAPKRLSDILRVFVELLAGIPSIIYGMWGLLVFAPYFAKNIHPWIKVNLGQNEYIGFLFQGIPTGINVLTASIVLSIMILPFITSVVCDAFKIVPELLKESAYGLGATTTEVVWKVMVPYARTAIVGGVILGLGRALGETMAVSFVIGNAHRLSFSLLDPGSTISSALANEFTEAESELYTASLVVLGLILFTITFIILGLSKLLLYRLKRSTQPMPFSPLFSFKAKLFPATNRWSFLERLNISTYKFSFMPLHSKRQFWDKFAKSFAAISLFISLFWLCWILFTLFYNGFSGLGFHVFTQMTPPPGGQGGLLNAIAGSLLITVLAVIIGTPIGLMAGIYLAEYNRSMRVIRSCVRFLNDVLLSAPSIIIGLYVYEFYVVPMQQFAGFAGVLALAIIVIPIVVRVTENTFNLIPVNLREACIALGATKYECITKVLFSVAKTGTVTGVLLAIARISGETAPLLFTALNNQFWSLDLTKPMANLPSVIFQYAMSPFNSWHQLAWTGALLITLWVLGLNLIARLSMRNNPTLY